MIFVVMRRESNSPALRAIIAQKTPLERGKVIGETMIAETTKAASGPTAEQIEQYERDGYIVARGLFSPAEIAEIRDAFMNQAAAGCVENLFELNARLAETDPLARYPRVMQPHRYPDLEVGRVAMKYLCDPRVAQWITTITGVPHLVAQSMFYFKPPTARGQALHQDNFYLQVKPGTCMAAWTAVDPATQENGGLMVVPGTHKIDVRCPTQADHDVSFTSEYVAPPDGAQPVPVDLDAGDVLFFNGSVIHGSSPNNSKTMFRRSFICHYAPATLSESSHWYLPLMTFEGEYVDGVAAATDGGPCGTPVAGPH